MSGGFALPEADAADQAPSEHVDVLIVGAGLSGIGAAWHLGTRLPAQSYLILESRAVIGGTWDLFRYPGVRSDSDMYTLGYAFRPCRGARAIAEGADILPPRSCPSKGCGSRGGYIRITCWTCSRFASGEWRTACST